MSAEANNSFTAKIVIDSQSRRNEHCVVIFCKYEIFYVAVITWFIEVILLNTIFNIVARINRVKDIVSEWRMTLLYLT